MSETPGLWDDVPAPIKLLGFASFALSVTLVLLVHHYWMAPMCPVPQ